MHKKGFTLIELLAVIIILALVALIAVPLVLNMVEGAKVGVAKESATNYAKQVELSLTKAETINQGVYTLDKDGNIESPIVLDIPMKGDKAKEGVICVDENGAVLAYSLKVNNYYITKIGSEQEITESINQDVCEEVIDPTIEIKAQKLLAGSQTYNYMGGTYLRGEQENNYVWYNGFMWRIMGINSDGTVRLITDENVTVLSHGGDNYIGQKGYINDWLNEYFYDHLNGSKNMIVEGSYFCSEALPLASDSNEANKKLQETKRTECASESVITAKVGIISADEYNLSAPLSLETPDYYDADKTYLNIGMDFWTMTKVLSSQMGYVDGQLHYMSMIYGSYGKGIRPVINIQSSSIIKSGNGSAQNFYILEGEKVSDVKGTIAEKATSGEYVLLEGKTYRLISKENDGVRLILDDHYRGKSFYDKFGNSNQVILDSGIGQELNGKVLDSLGLTNSDKIVTTTYYQGEATDSYQTLPYQYLLKQSNGFEAKVGLIRVGDILAGHSATMLTKNYTEISNKYNVPEYWTMTRTGSNKIILINMDGGFSWEPITYNKSETAVRPVITVRNDLEITGGTGTWKKPYQI